jgi:hypothetical protein
VLFFRYRRYFGRFWRFAILWDEIQPLAANHKSGSTGTGTVPNCRTDISKILLLKTGLFIRIRIRITVINWILIRIRVKGINWIRIRISLQMTSQNVWNTYEPT